jgi:phage baseplate assembly protein W
MTSSSRLYDKITVSGKDPKRSAPIPRTYRGFSTISADSESYTLFDLALIKQDIINHFHIRQGERLMNPEFGTIIWDMLFENFTDDVKKMIAKDVETIVNYDPRISVNSVTVDSTDQGIRIEANLTYLPFNISERMTFNFDKNNSIII